MKAQKLKYSTATNVWLSKAILIYHNCSLMLYMNMIKTLTIACKVHDDPKIIKEKVKWQVIMEI